jgi:hypothetical protein
MGLGIVYVMGRIRVPFPAARIIAFIKFYSLVSCQLSVGAKHLEDKLSVIAKNSSPNASPVQLSVGAKHLEDKLSVIAKNSSPNASPVQLSVVSWNR